MTEDNGDPGDGFYRYIPNHHRQLHQGGKLADARGPRGLAVQHRPGQKVGRSSTASG